MGDMIGRMKRVRFCAEQEDVIVSKYLDGFCLDEIGRMMGTSRRPLKLVLKRRSVPLRKYTRIYPLNEHAFDVLAPDACYWIGFLMADGCVEDRSSGPVLWVTLAAQDVGHVRKLRTFLGAGHPIRSRPPRITMISGRLCNCQATAEFCCSSQRLADALVARGVTPRKSLTAQACGSLAFNRDFWRGYVDGNGSIILTPKNIYVQLTSGSCRVIEQFREYIRTIAPKFTGQVSRRGNRGTDFSMHVSGIMAQQVAEEMYHGATTFLERKKASADRFTAWLPARKASRD